MCSNDDVATRERDWDAFFEAAFEAADQAPAAERFSTIREWWWMHRWELAPEDRQLIAARGRKIYDGSPELHGRSSAGLFLLLGFLDATLTWGLDHDRLSMEGEEPRWTR